MHSSDNGSLLSKLGKAQAMERACEGGATEWYVWQDSQVYLSKKFSPSVYRGFLW